MSKHVLSVRVEEDDLKEFNSRYLGLVCKYVQQAIKFALVSEDNFNNVMFSRKTYRSEVSHEI